MMFTAFRRFLFQVHMWIGLTLGLLFAALGLSGSAIVYDQEIANFLNPPPAAAAQGSPLSLDAIAAAARKDAASRGQLQISLPVVPGRAVAVRVSQPPRAEASGAGREGRRGAREGARLGQAPSGPGAAAQMFIDPVSGAVLGTRSSPLPPFLAFAHQLHGNFLMGRDGRTYVVGWLGVGMCILGLTGLVLWWPRRGQWKYAFIVRRKARGLRFHRELHAAVGIWIFVVFMAVSFSGVVLAWPQAMGAGAPGFDPRALPRLEPGPNRITAEAALDLAQKALPDAIPRAITLPARDDQPVNIAFFAHGSVAATVLVDPYLGKVITVRDPSESVMAWQRPVHQGLLGPVWRFLVFLSGFVPALFVVTGVVMWWKKYRRRIPMNAPLAEEVAA